MAAYCDRMLRTTADDRRLRGSGMSEAAETFAVIWCARHLMRWTRSLTAPEGSRRGLGLALGLGYLARYEVVPGSHRRRGVRRGAATLWGTVACAASPRHSRTRRDHPVPDRDHRWGVGAERLGGQPGVVRHPVSRSTAMTASWTHALQRGCMSHAGVERLGLVAARLFGMQPLVDRRRPLSWSHTALTRRLAALVPVLTFGPVLVFAAWGQLHRNDFRMFPVLPAGHPFGGVRGAGFLDGGMRRTGRPRGLGAVLLCTLDC